MYSKKETNGESSRKIICPQLPLFMLVAFFKTANRSKKEKRERNKIFFVVKWNYKEIYFSE